MSRRATKYKLGRPSSSKHCTLQLGCVESFTSLPKLPSSVVSSNLIEREINNKRFVKVNQYYTYLTI
jgi:hypothetical protein